jgi:uncharacterized repeat protein (TIGR03803 family)
VNFAGANGANPGRPPIQGRDGNLYGTTTNGGANGHGVLFKMTPAGALTPLYSFCPETGCADGSHPSALALGTDGNFYGGAANGGAFGYGTIFKVTGEDTLTTLHSFDGTDGASPFDRMVQVSSGNFYGTTPYGGNLGECGGIGCGTVFEITPSGTLTTLHDFCSLPDCADGGVLFESLALDTDGDFYGATWVGGPANAGTVFKITPTGTLTTIYSFCVVDYPFCSDGIRPLGPVLGKDGNFYGTTASGGANGEGSVFKITPSGTLTTIYSFCAQIACMDGSDARSGIILGSDGNFYGTTYYGGVHNEGTVFKITRAGVLTTLHSFDGTDGYDPIGVLFQATNGAFYGQTTLGGSGGDGTIFSLAVGLHPFVETVPTSGTVGTNVIILGNELTGATSVTFNGTAAVFKVVSSSEIKATVPGATTGEVKVTTPSGTLTSNVNFRVTTPLPAGLGGSNYGWYYLAPPCNGEPYGVVYNYDTATATIDAQLRQMYDNGQRRLRIPIFHARGINSGTIMDSTGGNLAPRFQANLGNLLAAIKAAGFVEIEVGFFPQSNNSPIGWTTFSDDYFQENWSLIQNLHPIIAGAGISYHIDLMNEGIPPLGWAVLLQYDQMLWNDYVAEFGSDDTLGFSIIADSAHVGQVSAAKNSVEFASDIEVER